MPQTPSPNDHEGALLGGLVEISSRGDLARLGAICAQIRKHDSEKTAHIEGLGPIAGMALIDAAWLVEKWREYPHLWELHEVALPSEDVST